MYNKDMFGPICFFHNDGMPPEQFTITGTVKKSFDSLTKFVIKREGMYDNCVIKDFNIDLSTKKVSEAREYLNKNFRLHKIAYAPEKVIDKLSKKISRKSKNNKISLQNIGKIINKNIKLISPLDLKINYKAEESCAKLSSPFGKVISGNVGENFFVFSEIELNSKNGEIEEAGVAYIHEIIHTQLESRKNSYKNYYLSEAMSIFGELKYCFDINDTKLLKKVLNFKLENTAVLAYNFDELDDIQKKYLYSQTVAINLFEKYINGSEEQIKEMNHDMQSIFDGELSVEEFTQKNRCGFYNFRSNEVIKDMERLESMK